MTIHKEVKFQLAIIGAAILLYNLDEHLFGCFWHKFGFVQFIRSSLVVMVHWPVQIYSVKNGVLCVTNYWKKRELMKISARNMESYILPEWLVPLTMTFVAPIWPSVQIQHCIVSLRRSMPLSARHTRIREHSLWKSWADIVGKSIHFDPILFVDKGAITVPFVSTWYNAIICIIILLHWSNKCGKYLFKVD